MMSPSSARGSVRSFAAVLVVVLTVSGIAVASDDPDPRSHGLPMAFEDLPYGIGEECTFEIGYGPIKAGTATISVVDTMRYFGQSVVHVRTRARSNRFFDAFFKVRDQATSYIDADSLFARYHARSIREGGYEKNFEIHFDQIDGIAYEPDGDMVEFEPPIHDVLSAFFRVRTMPLEDGAMFDLPSHDDDKVHQLKISVLRREVRDTPVGRVRCVVVQPTLGDAGLFRSQGDLFVWFTDDERRIPVLMKATVPVGAIEATLIDYVAGDRN